MKIIFIAPWTEGRPVDLNGDSIRFGSAAASGTEQSIILIAEHLASTGADVTVAFHKTIQDSYIRGVRYVNFEFSSIAEEEFDFLVSCLGIENYEGLPFKVTKGLIYVYHMAWVYSINEMIEYCLTRKLTLGLINVSMWAETQNLWNINLANKKLPRVISDVIPNPIMTDMAETALSFGLERKEKSTIFHAQYGQGADVVRTALKELEWPEMVTFDYVNPATGVDKETLFNELVQAEYFVYPQIHPNGCLYKHTFSCSVAEALAAGVIVLTYYLGAIPEYFGSHCVFLDFPEGIDMNKMVNEKVSCDAEIMNSTRSITDKLLYLDSHPEEREDIRRRSIAYIKDRFNIQRVGKMWEDFLNKF